MPDPNIFVVEDYKMVFVGIPKTGQTSVKRAFLGPDVKNVHHPYHFPYIKKREVLTYKEDGYLCVTVVRNPYDRLYSFWKQKVAVPNKLVEVMNKPFRRPIMRTGMPFEECVDVVSGIADGKANIHFRSQWDQLTYDEEYLPQFTGYYETLREFWIELEKRLGKKLPDLPWENRTREDGENYLDFYTPDMLRCVYQRFQRDFEGLGYEPRC